MGCMVCGRLSACFKISQVLFRQNRAPQLATKNYGSISESKSDSDFKEIVRYYLMFFAVQTLSICRCLFVSEKSASIFFLANLINPKYSRL